jgi:hypothetical protein
MSAVAGRADGTMAPPPVPSATRGAVRGGARARARALRRSDACSGGHQSSGWRCSCCVFPDDDLCVLNAPVASGRRLRRRRRRTGRSARRARRWSHRRARAPRPPPPPRALGGGRDPGGAQVEGSTTALRGNRSGAERRVPRGMRCSCWFWRRANARARSMGGRARPLLLRPAAAAAPMRGAQQHLHLLASPQ